MMSMLKRKKNNPENSPTPAPETAKKGLFSRLKSSLSKTRTSLTSGIASLVLGKKTLGPELLNDIETQLLSADVGFEATEQLMKNLTQKLARKQLTDVEAVMMALREEMTTILKPCEASLTISAEHKPFVILVVGVNGSGKTTTIGKLAKQFVDAGKSVMLAAGDTFRAAAIEQLQVWGQHNNVSVIAQQAGADPAAVIFDALESARAKKIDVLIADTAGRLHTQKNLMEELKKVERVIKKIIPDAPHETLLVLDAGIGQNAIVQAQQFHEAVHVSGIALTKLDGTAKGGVIFAIAKKLNIPLRFIGVGEGIEDLRPFVAEEFVEALFEEPST